MSLRLLTIFLISLFIYSKNTSGQDAPRVVHVFVALCDNDNQGIVPVPQKIGNGQDPFNNLYWGAAYGVKTYFDKKSENWILLASFKSPSKFVLERIVFKNTESDTYLIADAYDGSEIKQTIIDFLHASSGQFKDTLQLDTISLLIGGYADMIAYIGHNGLMDFNIDEKYFVNRSETRDIILLACYSRPYFTRFMEKFNTNPLVWSNGLMSPEAYTLKWAIDGWIKGENNEQIVGRAREAYNHYQKCGINGATNLLSTGF